MLVDPSQPHSHSVVKKTDAVTTLQLETLCIDMMVGGRSQIHADNSGSHDCRRKDGAVMVRRDSRKASPKMNIRLFRYQHPNLVIEHRWIDGGDPDSDWWFLMVRPRNERGNVVAFFH